MTSINDSYQYPNYQDPKDHLRENGFKFHGKNKNTKINKKKLTRVIRETPEELGTAKEVFRKIATPDHILKSTLNKKIKKESSPKFKLAGKLENPKITKSIKVPDPPQLDPIMDSMSLRDKDSQMGTKDSPNKVDLSVDDDRMQIDEMNTDDDQDPMNIDHEEFQYPSEDKSEDKMDVDQEGLDDLLDDIMDVDSSEIPKSENVQQLIDELTGFIDPNFHKFNQFPIHKSNESDDVIAEMTWSNAWGDAPLVASFLENLEIKFSEDQLPINEPGHDNNRS